MKYIDPTGHGVDCGIGMGCVGDYVPPSSGNGGDGGSQPPIIIPELPCGGLKTCGQQSLNDYYESLLPFTSSDACYFLIHDPILCEPSSWQNFPNVSLTSGFGYQLNVFGLGAGAIAGFFPAQATGGVDAIYLSEANSVVVYGYTGTSLNTAGAGVAAGPYAIVGFNIEEPTDYSGVSQAVNVTVAYGHGATISYFWSGEEPLAPGAPQGLTIWYSPGLAASVSYSNVTYNPWVAIP